jgi:hypothetical protein
MLKRSLVIALRIAIFCATLLVVVGPGTQSDAYIAHAWCTSGHGWAGGLSCGFDTYEHCLENARLINANCVANPFVDNYPQVPPRPQRSKGR